MLDGRFGRLSLESSARDVLATLGEPPDFVRRRAGEGVWSVLWQYGALEFEGKAVPDALGLDVGPLRDEATLGEFDQLACTPGSTRDAWTRFGAGRQSASQTTIAARHSRHSNR